MRESISMLAASNVWAFILTILFIFSCVVLVLCILLQKGRGGGLGAAFGGASSAFGTQTGDVLTGVTIILTAAFLLLAIGLGYVCRPEILPLPMPTFTPEAPGELDAVNNVRITGPKGVAIHYSVNGQEFSTYDPGADGEQTIEVPSGSTLEAYCSRPGFDDSPRRKETYGVEVPEEVAPVVNDETDVSTPAEDAPTEAPAEAPADVPTETPAEAPAEAA
jgi:protein translocase SecG subunit